MAIEQNRGDVDAISKALGNIVNHRYDLDHSRCPSWCNRKTPSHVIKVAKEQVAQYIQRYQEQKFLTRIKDAHNSQAAESFFSRLIQVHRTVLTVNDGWNSGQRILNEIGVSTGPVLSKGNHLTEHIAVQFAKLLINSGSKME